MDAKELSKRVTELTAEARAKDALSIRLYSATSIYSNDRPWIHIVSWLPINGPIRRCIQDFAIDIAGRSRTDAQGRMSWKLSDYICRATVPTVEEPASFVATPVTDTPAYLTTRIAIPSPPSDLLVDVFSWQPGGGPAGNVFFSWRCRVRYEEPIPIIP